MSTVLYIYKTGGGGGMGQEGKKSLSWKWRDLEFGLPSFYSSLASWMIMDKPCLFSRHDLLNKTVGLKDIWGLLIALKFYYSNRKKYQFSYREQMAIYLSHAIDFSKI